MTRYGPSMAWSPAWRAADEDAHQHVMPVVAGVVRHRQPRGEGREAERGAHVGRPEDEGLGPVARRGDLVDVGEPGRALDLQLEADPTIEAGRLLELVEEGVGERHLAGPLDLGQHDAVHDVAGPLDHGDHVPVAPPRRGGVHPDHHGLPRPVAGPQRLDHVAPGLVLGQGGDRVLEVEEHLVGREARALGEHLGRRPGDGQARAPRSDTADGRVSHSAPSPPGHDAARASRSPERRRVGQYVMSLPWRVSAQITPKSRAMITSAQDDE